MIPASGREESRKMVGWKTGSKRYRTRTIVVSMTGLSSSMMMKSLTPALALRPTRIAPQLIKNMGIVLLNLNVSCLILIDKRSIILRISDSTTPDGEEKIKIARVNAHGG